MHILTIYNENLMQLARTRSNIRSKDAVQAKKGKSLQNSSAERTEFKMLYLPVLLI